MLSALVYATLAFHRLHRSSSSHPYPCRGAGLNCVWAPMEQGQPLIPQISGAHLRDPRAKKKWGVHNHWNLYSIMSVTCVLTPWGVVFLGEVKGPVLYLFSRLYFPCRTPLVTSQGSLLISLTGVTHISLLQNIGKKGILVNKGPLRSIHGKVK